MSDIYGNPSVINIIKSEGPREDRVTVLETSEGFGSSTSTL